MLSTSQWCFGAYRLDAATTCLWRDAQLLPLPPKPLAVLTYLVAHAGQVVTKDTLLEAVWPETVVSEGVLKTCIGQIRQVLEETGRTPHYIATIHRRGYRFIAPVTIVEPSASGHAAMAYGLSSSAGRHTPAPPAGVAAAGLMVARDTEFAQLQQCWAQTLLGRRQIVCITGEAGIGKTTLVDAFMAQLGATETLWHGRGQCIEQYGAGEAYLPVLEALGQLGRGPDGVRLVEILRQQAPGWLLQLPALLSAADYDALQGRSGSPTRERMLRELAEAIETLTAEHPLVLVLEDLHWSDSATVDWLAFVAHRRTAARLLVLGTYRPADAVMRGHPVHTVLHELQRHGQGTEIPLDSLSEAGVATYLARRFGEVALPAGLARVLQHRTNGNPFFLVTVVEELVRQGILVPQATGWILQGELETVAVGVPENVRQLIEQQLAQVRPEVQAIMEAASVAGIEFAATAVAAAVDQSVEDIEACCDALARRGQFVRSLGLAEWPDETVATRYGFLHSLYSEVVYERVPVSRRTRWHRQIGTRLEAGYGVRAREIAAELAAHFGRGREYAKAIQYLQYAGDNALHRSAPHEAIHHLREGLALLYHLPNTPVRDQCELTLRLALGTSLSVTKGWPAPEVGQAYSRAQYLCQQAGETAQLFPVLWGLWHFHAVRGEPQTARELGEQLLTLAQRHQESAYFLAAHFMLGGALTQLGALVSALTHWEQTFALYDPQQHHALTYLFGADPGVFSLSMASHALWLRGYPDQALMRSCQAFELAQELSHPFSLALAHCYAAMLHQFRREPRLVQQQAEAAVTLCTEQGFTYYLAWATILRGWALTTQSAARADGDAMAQLRQGVADLLATGAGIREAYYRALLAEAAGYRGQRAAGQQLLAEAFAAVQHTGERYWEAELYRLQGELLGQEAERPQGEGAEASLLRALEVARGQQAKSLELRAAISLSRLWRQQGKRQAAYALLEPIYDWFTEGFDTADLQEAGSE